MPARRRSSSSDDTTDEGGSSPARSRARGGAGRRVLIAGCGYVGVRLASRLAREGASVFALRRGRGPLGQVVSGRHVIASTVLIPQRHRQRGEVQQQLDGPFGVGVEVWAYEVERPL